MKSGSMPFQHLWGKAQGRHTEQEVGGGAVNHIPSDVSSWLKKRKTHPTLCTVLSLSVWHASCISRGLPHNGNDVFLGECTFFQHRLLFHRWNGCITHTLGSAPLLPPWQPCLALHIRPWNHYSLGPYILHSLPPLMYETRIGSTMHGVGVFDNFLPQSWWKLHVH